jgi:hypothetical protein
VTRRFRLFLLPHLTIPPSVWLTMPQLINMNSRDVKSRLERRGKTAHHDYFETLVPFDKLVPSGKKEMCHIQKVAGQHLLTS